MTWLKPEVKGKCWDLITSKPENITSFKDNGQLQVQFYMSLRELFFNRKKQTLGELKKTSFFFVFT